MPDDRNAEDGRFNLRARAELAMAFEPGDPPAHLFRRTPLLGRRGVRIATFALLLATVGGGVLVLRPPALVRGAIEHEYYERTLRGSFMDGHEMISRLGLGQAKAVPGFPQLMRPCDIDGHLVYHLTTFFEKGGMVTVFAFDRPVVLRESAGWWNNAYWQVVTSREGKPLLLVSEQRRALAVASANLTRPHA